MRGVKNSQNQRWPVNLRYLQSQTWTVKNGQFCSEIFDDLPKRNDFSPLYADLQFVFVQQKPY